ncbi:ABC transporter substrate-binding protein [Streptomyces sp. RB6PN25]|uniref:ABC transporter substrate-binding protein n=1 Tax=Streptomyces humicola TaxID=2953240 RepID=A0ABT1PUF7_9ACTN|nr:ABC transporter substrate-binding protein [Streptomyces humicola]MCQ4080165.1 ABC transporter substrate-binding protein [Streptomyces humicola]
MRGFGRVACAACAVMAVAAAAVGCGGGAGIGGPGIVRASWGDPQNPLEPANTNEVQGGKVLDMIFRGLKKYDPRTGAADNWIADSITTSDQQNFTVKLKPGWKFSDGEPVTAHSFVDAWNYGALVTDRQLNAPFFSYIDGYDQAHPASGAPTATTMSGLQVKDDLTFTVRLSQKFSTWPDTLGYSAFYPLPRTFFTDHSGWLKKPVGDGPYEITSYTRGAVMSLRKWDGYHGSDAARNKGVDLVVYTDNNTAYTDLQAGNLDLVDEIPATQLKNVTKDLGGRYVNEPAGIIQTITFPMYDAKWGGPNTDKLRRGISMAIDRAAITAKIFRNTRTPATDWTSPVLGAKGGYKENLCGDACTYNPAMAKSLIQQGGGLPGGHMSIGYNADIGDNKEWVDAVCNSINNVLGNGTACVGAPVGTFADFRSRITAKTETDPFRSGWQMDYPLIQDFLQPLYYTGGSSNDAHFSNPDFDKLVDRANSESDPVLAVAEFQRAEQILAQQMPAIPLWYQNGSVGYSSNISHVMLNQFSVPLYNEITVS